MTGDKELSSNHNSISVDAPQQSGETLLLARAQPLLKALFVGSIVALLIMWIAWSGNGYVIGVETPHGVSPTPSQSFWLIVASATSVASLLGMVSNTVLGLRKEQREARAEALDRRRQELEIEKLQLELERERASASKRIDSSPNTDDVAIQVGSNDVKRYVASNQAAKEPPFPLDGERNRLRDKWSELDGKYQDLTRLLGAVDKDLGLALDSERRLVLQEHRDELAVQRDEIAVSMADLERRLAGLGSAG